MFSEQPSNRGRPRIAQYTTVLGRAANYKTILTEKWPELGEVLRRCQREMDVTEAFQKHAQPYADEFVPRLASDILKLISVRRFPQRPNAQIKYIAESLAGRPLLTFRTSRDICARERVEEGAKSPYKILRKEFYVVCECGYKGPAENNACPKCSAQISFLEEELARLPGI